MKTVASDVVQELIRIISKSTFKREDQEIDLVLPWLCKRSQLLSNQKKSKCYACAKLRHFRFKNV